MRKQAPLAALAVLFLAAHLLSLSATLEDIDSVNFALGVRDFDVARHQPHPPGYPVYIALAKVSTAALAMLNAPAAAPRGLSLLAAVSGALLIPLLFWLYAILVEDSRVAWWAMALAVCSPLFWFTALRPLSDMTGLAFAIAAQTLFLCVLRGNPHQPATGGAARPDTLSLLIAGSVLSGLAAGIRVQTVVLTAPLFAAALLWPGTNLPGRHRLLALVAAAAGVLIWGVPLLVASGGLRGYLDALGTQAGEDFSGVVMLWTTRQARVAANALLFSFIWPWGTMQLGAAVFIVAVLGFARLAWRNRRALVLLGIAFGPYAVFHLLFHETATVRYALPLVVPIALLAAYAAAAMRGIGLAVTGASIVVASLVVTLPAARAYARDGSPAFRLFETMTAGSTRPGSGSDPGVIGMHAVMRRVAEWERDRHPARVIVAPHGREWLALVDHWRKDPDQPIRFFADPRRTDLGLFDPRARTLEQSARWTLPEMPFLAGTRPGGADWYVMRPPGWMLDRGWALTAEIGGVTAKEGAGPHVQPSGAWVRARAENASLIIGGRNLGAAGDPAARVTVAGERQVFSTWDVAPGFFFRRVSVPAGALAGSGYVPLTVRSAAADGSGRQVRVSLEQFDIQSEGALMFGLVDGWYEPEYNPVTARAWRWMSERARVWVQPLGRDVTLTLAGESPLRYFDHAPVVRVLVAGVEVSRFTPGADFTQQVTIPAKALTISGGLVVIESELWFVPAERGQSGDQRHLALRVYSVDVR